MFNKSFISLSRQLIRSKPIRFNPIYKPTSFVHQSNRIHSYGFSTSSFHQSAGQADRELIGRLESEIEYEKEVESTKEPTWLKNFKADQTFTINDISGSDEVSLTRTFGNEKIRILFSCSDIERIDEDEEIELENEENEKPEIESTRVRTAISIIKSGKGGMVIDSTTDGLSFEIDNVSFYDDEHLALDESSENDWKRRGLYIGPTFLDLDEDLQTGFTQFLEERGIGSELASVVANLAEHKEQKEYVSWLSKMSQFIKS
ncbi:mitochondrial glycoprotein [Melampsora americana]|nr:mitochondrial glycoprotein [Melampsora americana]